MQQVLELVLREALHIEVELVQQLVQAVVDDACDVPYSISLIKVIKIS